MGQSRNPSKRRGSSWPGLDGVDWKFYKSFRCGDRDTLNPLYSTATAFVVSYRI